METRILDTLLRRIGGRALRRREPSPPTVFEEMWLGAAVGLPAALTCAGLAGAAAPMAAAAATLGLCAGAVIGLVLWAGSDHLPEDLVLPVPPDQRRDRPEG